MNRKVIESPKGLNIDIIKKISMFKKEPKWMTAFRIKAYEYFVNQPLPSFGPKIDLNFDEITYYKSIDDKIHDSWDTVDTDVKELFENLGVIEMEDKYLAGISTQYESEVIYHNMLEEFRKKNIIFVDTDTALKKYPKLFKKYFNTLVNVNENKFTALNGAVWSGGSFIYIPPNTKLDRPLQSYFRINTENMGQFERTIIVVDDNSELEYIEGCTAPTYSSNSLHAAVVEIFVGKNAKCRYTTIQNWADNVYNLVTKRAIVDEDGHMEWVDGNIGSKVTMKYPAVILKGKGAKGTCITISVAKDNQDQDTGAKMIHLAPNTKSNIISKSISSKGGKTTYRGLVNITKKATNSISNVKCDSLIMDELSKSDAIPTNIVANKSSLLEHEATISRVEEEKLFYLMSRGLTKEQSIELIVLGFIETFRERLPMEYSVELNNLLKMNIA
jgi:Fe-S cluster assembly protein SufB